MAKAKPARKTAAKPAKKPTLRDLARKAEAAAGGAYEAKREKMAAVSRQQAAEGKEIGPIPPVKDQARRDRCRDSHELFARTYFPARFTLPSADCHIVVGREMEDVTANGGNSAVAMPRGTGKTAHAEVELIRAIVYGFRRFAVLIQATEKLAARSLKRVTRQLETNDLLLEDFPEVCFPIRCLERINQRSRGQTTGGRPTLMEWTAEGVILPTVEGSPSSGAAIMITGIESAARGLAISGPNGEMVRPDFMIFDDVQTRATAKSPVETAFRESIVTDDLMGMVGPEDTLAAIMLCTPIYVNDLAERFLDGQSHPNWRAIRTRMIETWPANMELWDEYAEVRRESIRSGNGAKLANEFLRKRWDELHAGAVVSWPDRKKPDELSGLQSAMNLYLDNPKGFKAEYQCEPEQASGLEGLKQLDPKAILSRLSGLPRGIVPREAVHLTAMIDCGGELHWYLILALDQHGGGSVIDYGSFPRQARSIFAASDPRPGLSYLHPNYTEAQRVYAGLQALTSDILGREYQRENGGFMRVERCLIDAGFQSSAVYQFVRQSPHVGIIYPSKGIGRTTTARGVSEWKSRPGERSGYHWRLTISETGRGRMVQFDPDAYKSKAHELLTTAPGGKGALMLFSHEQSRPGEPARPADHEMIAAHFAAEYAEPVTIRGTTFDKWQIRPDRPDNHLWDCLVGALVAASVQGLVWSATDAPVKVEQPAPLDLKAERAKRLAEKARVR